MLVGGDVCVAGGAGEILIGAGGAVVRPNHTAKDSMARDSVGASNRSVLLAGVHTNAGTPALSVHRMREEKED